MVEQPVDVCILGLGVAGGVIAAEAALAGYRVVGIEKGPYWDYAKDFSMTKYDEWGIMYHRKFDHPLRLFTYTLRNNSNQMAVPVRRNIGSQIITPGHGVGGMAQHYGGMMGRFGSWAYQMRSQTVSRYGQDRLNSVAPTNDIEDWPYTYSEIEPYYVEWERAFGVTGTNQGPFQPQSQNFPMPPHPYTPVAAQGFAALESMGYHPYPMPTSLASVAYVNQYGVQVNACVYDGWCGSPCNFQCETGAKANAAYRTIPAAMKSGNFTMALNCFVFRLDVDPGTKLVTAARYYDAQGRVHVQPAKAFYNGLWGFNLVRAFLLSGVGAPYNPATVTGSMGRGPQYGVPPPAVSSVSGTLDVGGNAYPSGNAEGGAVDMLDLADDNFDHAGLDFIGGGMLRLATYYGGGPQNLIGIAGQVSGASMGSAFKAGLKDYYLLTKTKVSLSMDGPNLPDQRWYVDADPHYTDWYGDPLARYTTAYSDNAYSAARYLSGSNDSPATKILQRMGCHDISVNEGVSPNSIPMDNWPAHVRGGCRMGIDPRTSALNKYGQMWDCANVFAGGEITDTTGDNTTIGGTHPMGAALYVHAEGIRRYLQSPGPLV